jgi:hypothetical protein
VSDITNDIGVSFTYIFLIWRDVYTLQTGIELALTNKEVEPGGSASITSISKGKANEKNNSVCILGIPLQSLPVLLVDRPELYYELHRGNAEHYS